MPLAAGVGKTTARQTRPSFARDGLPFTGLRGPAKAFLLIFSARILDSSVERGIPRRVAAPDGPKTRPPVARKASSMIAFSWAARALDSFRRLPTECFVDNQLSSTV